MELKFFPVSVPPYFYLKQIFQHCPKAGYTYCQLWENKNDDYLISITDDEVRSKYLTDLGKFRHDILMLEREALLNCRIIDDDMMIELIGWDHEPGGGNILC